MGKLLGIDPGGRRVGIALSDGTGTLASPCRNVDRQTEDLLKVLRKLVQNEGVDRIIVGFPEPLQVDSNERTREVETFIDQFIEPLSVPYETVSERYTTKEARRLREVRNGAPSQTPDEEAAALILQHYLDRDGPAGTEDRDRS